MCDAPGMSIRKRMESCPVHREVPEGFSLSEVEVRLATPRERPLWDALMDKHHYLGFRRLAGRGLRYVATFGDRWLGLAAWQNGAFKCAPRDRWTGWKPQQQFGAARAGGEQHPVPDPLRARGLPEPRLALSLRG